MVSAVYMDQGRTPGPGGKMITRECYWRCDVNQKGRGLQQIKISFRRVDKGNRLGDNKGLVENTSIDRTKGK